MGKMTCPQPRTNRGIRSLQSQCEVRTLREKIVKLQRELSSSKAETQNLAKQLKCLSLLVKRAWCGDMTAARHVAKIVGAAPPVMKVKSGPEGEKIVVVQTQPKVLHNWAFLTTRLLNKKDIKLEDLVCHLSTQKLEQREAYLDEQMETHDEILEATPASLKMASSSLHSSRARLLVRPRSGFVYNAINENTKTCLNDTEGFVLKKERPHSSTAVQEKKIQRSRTCLSGNLFLISMIILQRSKLMYM
ncbi:uncharacterized protein LOC122796931 [Protopterus annectens]|uniref:uncharacterized protein LOC122796931 n=1 Tax=Protopterus annectens TaxID=7888 RepID=UPI001CFBFE7D|nr:uncharacterized protein LOC122796931 [Protopterus annectens]